MPNNVRPKYPPDVEAALANAAEDGWPLESYQAVLSIALGHLEQDPPMPELVMMWAEADIEYDDTDVMGHPCVHRIKAGEFYFVCPVCCERTQPSVWEDGTEYRRAYFDDVSEGPAGTTHLGYQIGDNDDFQCDDWGALCDGCSTRLSVPVFLDAEYV